MTVGDLCNRDVVVAGPATSVLEAAKLMREFHVGDLVILEDDSKRAIGVVTDRDIIVEVIAPELGPESLTVADIMTETLVGATEDMDFFEALALMRKHGVRRLPVVNAQGGLEGILTLDDALELVGEAVANLVALVGKELEHEKDRRVAI